MSAASSDGTPAGRAVRWRSLGVSSEPHPDLEDAFPGRWNPRRAFPPEVGVAVHAIARALAAAGWWTPGSGDAVEAGQVVGVDLHPAAATWRFARDLEAGGLAAVRPSDFLFALPSSTAALAGVALGLDRYQATVAQHGLSGWRAVGHAADLVRTGRLQRVVAAAVTVVDPDAAAVLPGGASAWTGAEPFSLAVAWCLEAGEASGMTDNDGNAGHGPAATTLEEWAFGPDPGAADGVLKTDEHLADIPVACRSLAAPSLLAVDRACASAEPGAEYTIEHAEPVGGAGQLTVRVGQRPQESSAW